MTRMFRHWLRRDGYYKPYEQALIVVALTLLAVCVALLTVAVFLGDFPS